MMRGAGGSSGGVGRFFMGLIMLTAGSYLFFNAIQVTQQFGWGVPLYHVAGLPITSGTVLIPFVFGIGMIFYNAKNDLGWLLALLSLVMLGIGIINNLHFHLRTMSAFELLTILVLMIGGLGLFISSLRDFSKKDGAD